MLLANLSNEIPFPLQPVYSPSVLIEMMRPDGSSTIPVLNGDSLSADLAHELMGIQVKMILRFLNCVVLLLVLWAIPNNWSAFSVVLQGIVVAWCFLGICLQYITGCVRRDEWFVYVGPHAYSKLSSTILTFYCSSISPSGRTEKITSIEVEDLIFHLTSKKIGPVFLVLWCFSRHSFLLYPN